MRAKPLAPKASAERIVTDIRRATRQHYSAEDKIRIVLDGLRGEDSIAELCRREGIAQSLYYVWTRSISRLMAAWSTCGVPSMPKARSSTCWYMRNGISMRR